MTTQKQSKKAYSEQTRLGSPIPVVMGGGRMACRIKLSGKILEVAGVLPHDLIEVTARDGVVVLKKVAEPAPPEHPQERARSPRERQLDDLMEWSRRHEKGLHDAPDEPVDEPLSDAQLSGEAL